LEICGVDDDLIYLRYHRAHRREDYGRMIIARRDDRAYWLDQLTVLTGPQSAIEAAGACDPHAWSDRIGRYQHRH
jgi:hypothetical protein